MDKRVELELLGRKPDEVKELNLDNCRATQISGVTDDFVNLECLSIINVGLQTLKGFPTLPKLKRLDLSDNRLSDGLEYLSTAENVTHLNLSGNKIATFTALEPLQKLQHLKFLDMFNCAVTKTDEYRTKIFELLPTLLCLDGYDKDDKEYMTEEDDDQDDFDDDDDDDDDDDVVDEEDDDEDDDDECGLEYLQSSRAAQDEDDTEDFEPDANGGPEDDEDDDIEDDEEDEEEEEDPNESRGTKRKFEEPSA